MVFTRALKKEVLGFNPSSRGLALWNHCSQAIGGPRPAGFNPSSRGLAFGIRYRFHDRSGFTGVSILLLVD